MPGHRRNDQTAEKTIPVFFCSLHLSMVSEKSNVAFEYFTLTHWVKFDLLNTREVF